MPQIVQPSIPVPNGSNIQEVLTAIRTYLITQANQSAGRASLTGTISATTAGTPQPSQFTLTKTVFQNVTFPTADNSTTVTVPILISATWTNAATGQTIVYNAPKAAYNGGTLGATV